MIAGYQPSNSIWSDHAILRALDLVDNAGLTMKAAARVLSQELGVPVARHAVIGIVGRIRKDDEAVEHLNRRAENADGAMGRFWWMNRAQDVTT